MGRRASMVVGRRRLWDDVMPGTITLVMTTNEMMRSGKSFADWEALVHMNLRFTNHGSQSRNEHH